MERAFTCLMCGRRGVSISRKPRQFCNNNNACRNRYYNLESKRLGHELGLVELRMPRGACAPGTCKKCDAIRAIIDGRQEHAAR